MNTWLRRMAVVASLLVPSGTWGATINVFLVPASLTVQVGETFTVDLKADIGEPVLGWGLDVGFDPGALSLLGSAVTPPWLLATSLDGDGLAGLAFPAVSGNGVLLATLTFQALALGDTGITVGYTPTDFTEGFPLAPGPGNPLPGFADAAFSGASVTVVPEPGTLLLLGTGLGALTGCRLRRGGA